MLLSIHALISRDSFMNRHRELRVGEKRQMSEGKRAGGDTDGFVGHRPVPGGSNDLPLSWKTRPNPRKQVSGTPASVKGDSLP